MRKCFLSEKGQTIKWSDIRYDLSFIKQNADKIDWKEIYQKSSIGYLEMV
jgi:hypothetical protein